MTSLAGRGNVERMHRGARVGSGADLMNSVTVSTDGDLRVALCEPNSVHTGVVLGQLVGAQRGTEPLHVVHVRVTGAAEFGNLLALDGAAKSGAGGLGKRFVLRVPPVACIATHTLVPVDAGGRLLRRDFQRSRKLGVTVDANVSGLRRGECTRQQHNNPRPHPTHTRLD